MGGKRRGRPKKQRQTGVNERDSSLSYDMKVEDMLAHCRQAWPNVTTTELEDLLQASEFPVTTDHEGRIGLRSLSLNVVSNAIYWKTRLAENKALAKPLTYNDRLRIALEVIVHHYTVLNDQYLFMDQLLQIPMLTIKNYMQDVNHSAIAWKNDDVQLYGEMLDSADSYVLEKAIEYFGDAQLAANIKRLLVVTTVWNLSLSPQATENYFKNRAKNDANKTTTKSKSQGNLDIPTEIADELASIMANA